MILISMYPAQWENRAATRDQQQAEAEHEQLARAFCSADRTKRAKQGSSKGKLALTRLLQISPFVEGSFKVASIAARNLGLQAQK